MSKFKDFISSPNLTMITFTAGSLVLMVILCKANLIEEAKIKALDPTSYLLAASGLLLALKPMLMQLQGKFWVENPKNETSYKSEGFKNSLNFTSVVFIYALITGISFFIFGFLYSNPKTPLILWGLELNLWINCIAGSITFSVFASCLIIGVLLKNLISSSLN